MNYAKASANWSWLRGYMPTLRLASRFLFDLLDYDLPPLSSSSSSSSSSTAGPPASLVRVHTSSEGGGGDGGGGGGGGYEGSTGSLASVPGSLMIDTVFARSNYTADMNAMLVGFFREFALAEEFVGDQGGPEVPIATTAIPDPGFGPGRPQFRPNSRFRTAVLVVAFAFSIHMVGYLHL